jgi:4-amino-4-deoxy-L-arabinose transferase-like glycosyltransferase
MRFPALAALLGAALFAAIVTFPGLGNGTLWDNSETAYGEVAREILLTHDWVVMHLNGQAWFVQPPLYFWLAAGAAKWLGLSPFALRLPSALATVAMSAALGLAVARVAGGRAGTLASIVLATSLMQAVVGRLAIMDALLDLCVLLAILGAYRAFAPHDDARARTPALLVTAAALAFGTLAKGPVAPVIVVLVTGGWLWWERRLSASLAAPPRGAFAGALALYALIVLPWFVAISLRVGPQATIELIGHYTVGRYTGIIENQGGGIYYYVPVIILGFFPWIAFAPAAFVRAFRVRADRGSSLTRLALVWSVIPFVFFSLAQTKLPNYIALLIPALAVLVALWFDRSADGIDRPTGLISAASIPLFVGGVAVAIALFSRNNALELGPVQPLLRMLGSGWLAGSLLTAIALAIRRTLPIAPFALAVTAGGAIVFIGLVAEPAVEPLKPIPQIARKIQSERAPGSRIAIRTIGGTNGLAYYASPAIITIDDTDPSYLALICRTSDIYVVTRAQDAAKLELLARGRGRAARDLGDIRHVTAVHVDGPACAESTSAANAGDSVAKDRGSPSGG